MSVLLSSLARRPASVLSSPNTPLRKTDDLIVAADEPQIQMAADKLRANGTEVIAVQADLATREGVDKLYEAIRACGRPVDALLANAGRGLGGAFLDQNPNEWRDVIETNITGTLDLI